MRNSRPSRPGVLLSVLLFCALGLASQQATIRFNPEAPFSPLEQQPGELEAYEAILDQDAAERRVALTTRFLADYPSSEFRHLVLRSRWEARIRQGDAERIIEVAQQGLEAQEHFLSAKLAFISDPSRIRGLAEFRFTIANQKAAYYQSIVEAWRDLGAFDQMVAYGELALAAATEAWDLYEAFAVQDTPEYQAELERSREMRAFVLFNIVAGYEEADDVARTIEYSERILQLTPDDLQTLMATSRIMSTHPTPSGVDPVGYLERARGYAEKAAEQLDEYFSGQARTDLDGNRRAALTGEAHHTLGLIHYRLEEWESAAESFGKAVEAVPDDPDLYYMLGMASRRLGDVEAFLSAYARAVFLDVPEPQVRADLETIFEAVNGSLEGLSEFIEDEGARIEARSSIDSVPERTARIDALIDGLEVLPTVFPPNRFCYQYYEFLASQDLRWAEDALEIGVGSGINSFIILDQGAGRVVGTDINENAVRTFEQNAVGLGFTDRIDARLVPLTRPEAFSVIEDDERFDLIISNPPWEASAEPQRISEYAFLDSGWVLLRSMLEGLSDHLKEDGKVWLLYGDPRVVPSPVPPAVEIIMEEAPVSGLDATVLYSNARCSIIELVVGR